ncbi:hypothetical protein MMC12_006002 [Toensbergia leucococca]|nr:hypothetical protein [Toensbergia leucococca]
MHLILTGATGLVGSAALAHMLSTPAITKISILSRSPVPLAANHEHVHVITHKDFGSYGGEVLERLKGAEGCVWALGVSVTDVGKEDYEKITINYPLAAAKSFSTLSDPFKFVYVSGEGATTTPTILTPRFGTTKGRAELALLALPTTSSFPTLRPYSVRPGYVDAAANPLISQSLPWSKRVAEWALAPVLRAWVPGMVTPTRELGRGLVELAMGGGGEVGEKGVERGRILSNSAFRRVVGL